MGAEVGHDLVAAPGLLGPVGQDADARGLLDCRGQRPVPVVAERPGRVGDDQEPGSWIGGSKLVEAGLRSRLSFCQLANDVRNSKGEQV